MTNKEYKEKCKNFETVEYTYEDAPEKVKRAYDKYFLINEKKYMKNSNHFEYCVASERIALFMDVWDFDYLVHLFANLFLSIVPQIYYFLQK